MQETVRQHYVPRTYLKRFSVEKAGSYFIHSLDRSESTKAPFEVNIQNICLEKYIYTLPGATVEERMIIERIYSDVWEKDYDKMYEWLTDPKKKSLSQQEREFIISTVVTMFYRTPNWNKYYYGFMDDMLKRDYAATKASGQNNFMFGNTKISIEGKTLEDIKREHREETKPVLILSQLRHAMKLISNRVTSDSIVISILADQEAFITSDNPVTCNNIEEGPIMPIDPSNILSLPLDARTHLALMPADDQSRLQSIHRTTYAGNLGKFSVLALNFGQEKNADRFLLGKASAITTYMQDKVRMESEEPDKQTKKLRSMISEINSIYESFKQNQ